MKELRLLVSALPLVLPVSVAHAQLLISEFMADNRDTIVDEDGDASDWVEVHNAGLSTVDMGGWYLTDDPLDLDRWRFPAISLDAGGYLLVFASGKDRRIPGLELHTNFRLGTDGEYLALVRPDGETVEHHFSPAFPEQITDFSYGIGQEVNIDPLVSRHAEMRVLIPLDDSQGTAWQGGDEPYDDTSWIPGSNGVGYVTSVPGFAVTNYSASVSVSDLNVAEQVIENEGMQLAAHSENVEVIDYLGTSATGHYGNNYPFPGTTAGQNVDDFVVLAKAVITIPAAGAWTFGVLSDDGFRLDIAGRGDSFHIEHAAPRGPADTLGVFNAPEPGEYGLELVMYERGGGSGVELFAAPGSHGSWNAMDFRLVGNTEVGGLEVRSEVASSGSLTSYLAYIGTDVEQPMLGVNTSAYVRVPFSVGDASAYESLTLRMRYDDGFVAYLNGAEVARRNAPSTLDFDSRATADRPNSLARSFEEINITQHLNLLRDGSNLLALHGLNDEVRSSDFLIYAELAEIRIESNVPGFFGEPTPGEPNASSLVDFVRDTKFSVDRGFFEGPFQVVITTATEGAEIHYTLDGTEPTETHGSLYTRPIIVDRTTTLRAAAFREGFIPTNVDTHTYVFPDDVILQDYQATLDAGFPSMWGDTTPDYGMDPDVIGHTGPDRYGGRYAATIKDDLLSIPTMSIVMKTDDMFGPSGIYTHSTSRGLAWERPCSVELMFPDGSEGFQENCGIRIQGGAFRGHGLTKKHSFRLLFKAIYGATKLRYPLFGAGRGVAQRFDTITLRCNSNDGWQWASAGDKPLYIRDSFSRETLLDMGGVASHETFVHLYINGIYWGLYNPVERPDASFSAEYFGGDKEEWDSMSHGSLNSGSSVAWNTMLSLSQQGLASDAAYEAIQGNNPDGTPNPDLESYVDVDNLIDCMIANIYGGNGDWPGHNYWTARRRVESTGFKFYVWDAEWVLDLGSSVNSNRTGVDNGLAVPYAAMRENAEFRQRFGDRVHQCFYHGGPLCVDPANPQWDPEHPERNVPAARFVRLANVVDRAIVAESARWGDQHAGTPYTRDEHWEAERDDLLTNYFPRRSAIVVSHFRGAGLYPSIDAPTFSQHGGHVDPDFVLYITAPLGVVYYTLDGSDPRLRGGGIAPSAIEAGSAVGRTLIRSGDTATVHVPVDGALGLDWTGVGFDDSGWTAGPTGVGYETGSGYEDLIGVDVESEMYNQTTSVYIRVPFVLDDPAGFTFLTLKMKYDDGFVAYLNGVQVAGRNDPPSPQWDSAATGQNSDSSAVTFETIEISEHVGLLRQGVNILAIHGLNVGTTSSDLIFVPELAGSAASEGQGVVFPPGTTRLRSRALDGDEWSALSEAIFISGGPLPLRVTELMYHPPDPPVEEFFDDEDYEFLEIQNVGDRAVDLTGVSIRGGIEFHFDDSAIDTLLPGEYLVVVENLEAFRSRYDAQLLLVAGEYSGRLGNATDQVSLVDPLGETILEFDYSDEWYPVTDGGGFSLVIDDAMLPVEAWDDPRSWRPSADLLGSPGRDDTGSGPVRGWQRPGDANQDGRVDISDPIALLFHLFGPTTASLPCDGDSPQDGGNFLLLNVNGDDAVDLSDVVHALGYLFLEGPAPSLGESCVRIEGCPHACVP